MATKLLDTLEVEVQDVATTHGDLWTWVEPPPYQFDQKQVRVPTKPILPEQRLNYGPNEETQKQAKTVLNAMMQERHPERDVSHWLNVNACGMSAWTLMTTVASEGLAIWYWSRTVTFEARLYAPAEETP